MARIDSTPTPLTPGLYDNLGLYATGEESLRLTAFSGLAVTLALEGRFTKLDGTVVPFAERLVPATDRTPSSLVVPLTEGWVSNVSVRASTGTPRRGQTFVLVELVRGQSGTVQPLTCLLQGYVQDTTRRAWPGSPIEQFSDGRGVIRSITGTDPAANTEISETVPTNARWRLIGLAVPFVADANVANRVIVVTFDDGTNVYLRAPAAGNVTAGQTVQVSLGAFGHTANSFTQVWPSVSVPDLVLMGGHRIRTVTSGIQVGDNYGGPQYLVEEWIED